MPDKTYITICKGSRSTIQLNVWAKTTGTPFYPSGAYYTVKGADKDNTIIPRTQAGNYQNELWATITQTVTSSAALYDVYWEIHSSDKDIRNHCTKVLVIEEC